METHNRDRKREHSTTEKKLKNSKVHKMQSCYKRICGKITDRNNKNRIIK